MASAHVLIEGITPLLMNAFTPETPRGFEKWSPKEQAEYRAYRTPDTGELYEPGANLRECFRRGAKFSKGRGRASLMLEVSACVMVLPEQVCLLDENGQRVKEYEVDGRRVVIRATKGAVMRYRPKILKWRLEFDIEWDDTLMNGKQIKQVVEDSGRRVGLGDFRPEKGGYFGRFTLVSFQEE